MTRLKISLFSGICMHLKKFGRYAKYPSFYLKPKCIIHTDVCVCSATRELHFPEKQKKKTIFVQKRKLAKLMKLGLIFLFRTPKYFQNWPFQNIWTFFLNSKKLKTSKVKSFLIQKLDWIIHSCFALLPQVNFPANTVNFHGDGIKSRLQSCA